MQAPTSLNPGAAGLTCPAGGFTIDPQQPVDLAVLTHAHADHARPGSRRYLAVAPAEALLRARLGEDAELELVEFDQRLQLGDVTLSFHPAGHMLGSAQLRLEHEGTVTVVTGDFKRASDPTCRPFAPLVCDELICEATFALPLYRWPEPAQVLDELLAWRDSCREEGLAAVVYVYAAGKAQRLLAELLARGQAGPVWVHGAVERMAAAYRQQGVALPETRLLTEKERGTSLAGELIVAPPAARGSPWARRLGRHQAAFASGWMRVRGNRRRRNLQRGFVLSDHADWPALLSTIEESGARRVFTQHGYAEELARYLGETQDLEAAALPDQSPRRASAVESPAGEESE